MPDIVDIQTLRSADDLDDYASETFERDQGRGADGLQRSSRYPGKTLKDISERDRDSAVEIDTTQTQSPASSTSSSATILHRREQIERLEQNQQQPYQYQQVQSQQQHSYSSQNTQQLSYTLQSTQQLPYIQQQHGQQQTHQQQTRQQQQHQLQQQQQDDASSTISTTETAPSAIVISPGIPPSAFAQHVQKFGKHLKLNKPTHTPTATSSSSEKSKRHYGSLVFDEESHAFVSVKGNRFKGQEFLQRQLMEQQSHERSMLLKEVAAFQNGVQQNGVHLRTGGSSGGSGVGYLPNASPIAPIAGSSSSSSLSSQDARDDDRWWRRDPEEVHRMASLDGASYVPPTPGELPRPSKDNIIPPYTPKPIANPPPKTPGVTDLDTLGADIEPPSLPSQSYHFSRHAPPPQSSKTPKTPQKPRHLQSLMDSFLTDEEILQIGSVEPWNEKTTDAFSEFHRTRPAKHSGTGGVGTGAGFTHPLAFHPFQHHHHSGTVSVTGGGSGAVVGANAPPLAAIAGGGSGGGGLSGVGGLSPLRGGGREARAGKKDNGGGGGGGGASAGTGGTNSGSLNASGSLTSGREPLGILRREGGLGTISRRKEVVEDIDLRQVRFDVIRQEFPDGRDEVEGRIVTSHGCGGDATGSNTQQHKQQHPSPLPPKTPLSPLPQPNTISAAPAAQQQTPLVPPPSLMKSQPIPSGDQELVEEWRQQRLIATLTMRELRKIFPPLMQQYLHKKGHRRKPGSVATPNGGDKVGSGGRAGGGSRGGGDQGLLDDPSVPPALYHHPLLTPDGQLAKQKDSKRKDGSGKPPTGHHSSTNHDSTPHLPDLYRASTSSNTSSNQTSQPTNPQNPKTPSTQHRSTSSLPSSNVYQHLRESTPQSTKPISLPNLVVSNSTAPNYALEPRQRTQQSRQNRGKPHAVPLSLSASLSNMRPLPAGGAVREREVEEKLPPFKGHSQGVDGRTLASELWKLYNQRRG
ncbi:hypothetical protein HDU97_005355 [Phlyctochytrium planicorne]|nr:hypothetical protein HDU97_005355 [Phlyctochytrium planicorne]